MPLYALIVEVSERDALYLTHVLKQGGYSVSSEWANTLPTLAAALDRQEWQILILSDQVPQCTLHQALDLIRQRRLSLPILVVSSDGGEEKVVAAIKAGADEFVGKHHLQRLVPAVQTLLHEKTPTLDHPVPETLLDREANLLALIENTQDAVWSVNVNYQLVTLNSNFKKLFYWVFKTKPQKGIDMVGCLPPDYQDLWRSYYDRALQGERFAIEETYPLGRHSAEFEIHFNPIEAQMGKITGVAVFGRDITDRKRAEADLQHAKDQLQAVLDAVPGCVSWFSSDMTYLGINRYLAATFKLQPEDFIGKKLGFLESSGGFGEFVYKFFGSDVKESAIELATIVDGVPRQYLMVAQKYYQDQAAVFVGIDITDRKQVEEALRESQERYTLAVKGANDGLWDWNFKTNEIYFGPRWKSMLGCEEWEVSNSPEEWFKRIHPDDLELVKAKIDLHLKGATLHFETEHRMLHKDGQYLWVLCRGLAVRNGTGKATRMAGSQTDITERKNAEEQLLHDAFHDALTGLPNRALFLDRLGQAMERARRSSADRFAVLFLDLDRFKVVNDSLGHTVGDELLKQIAKILQRECLPSGDTVARLGGDEFVILLEQIQSLRDATCLADRIHDLLKAPFRIAEYEVFTTASIGIALSQTGYENPEDLLRDADIAMYRAKSQGKACHEVFDTEMYRRACELLQLQTDLRRAIEREELRVYYQPIVELRTGLISGFEALVRWKHPERGLVSPVEFIPVAEETGLIIPIGSWILREACRQLRIWQERFPSEYPLTMSVNLSGRQFSQDDLIQDVAQILAATGLYPASLKLEITESVVMEDARSAIALLGHLKQLGVSLQIDDFGTGYSSLSYLHRFPTDTLKIDQSFVARLGTTDDSSEIIRAIVTLAHNLGMTVTAEGIETLEQMSQLRSFQCEHGQGFLFSRAVDSRTAEQILIRQACKVV
ncbi:MAG: EAL domain-containing protein [Leptolyngbyaceae cyanobacterium bins.59]|nr:EAL domain-containing protein [Leptolyngbyaceae cyanobacterium bins.59]